MATTDAFSAQIVDFVRKMPAEALLELVKQKLGAPGASPLRGLAAASVRRGRTARAQPAESKPKRAAKSAKSAKSRAGRPRKTPAISQERQETLNHVERVVKQSSGMSASDVAKAAGLPQPRAAAALKELKMAKRIFQGGDRRFARYAGDLKAAELASESARKSATGPITAKKSGGSRKRAKEAAAK
jgi:hypothetical protein